MPQVYIPMMGDTLILACSCTIKIPLSLEYPNHPENKEFLDVFGGQSLQEWFNTEEILVNYGGYSWVSNTPSGKRTYTTVPLKEKEKTLYQMYEVNLLAGTELLLEYIRIRKGYEKKFQIARLSIQKDKKKLKFTIPISELNKLIVL